MKVTHGHEDTFTGIILSAVVRIPFISLGAVARVANRSDAQIWMLGWRMRAFFASESFRPNDLLRTRSWNL